MLLKNPSKFLSDMLIQGLFEDFHKLSVEKEILKIGQDLTELDVNASLEILENLINLMNFVFEWM
jgi:hypothetical protein